MWKEGSRPRVELKLCALYIPEANSDMQELKTLNKMDNKIMKIYKF